MSAPKMRPTADTITLNNGVEMPLIGMGTWPLTGIKLMLLTRKAVKLGYRGFDTSAAYRNEKWLGRGIRFCSVPRMSLFITTKLSDGAIRAGRVEEAFHDSLRALGMEYVDLYLMHWPVCEKYLAAWKQMEEFYRAGKVRAIGVCNCHQHHLEELLAVADVVPAVNQVELHPLLTQATLVEFCHQKGIRVEAYTPLARMHPTLIESKCLAEIASRHEKTVPQIILRWDYQHGYPVIPKSSHSVRLAENMAVCNFSLSEGEMDIIDGLNINFRVRHDPDNCRFTQ